MSWHFERSEMGTNAIHCNVLEDAKHDVTSISPVAERTYRRLRLEALPHQLEVWRAIEEGASGVLHAPTGSGKTLAVAAPLLQRALGRHPTIETGLRILWITPLRALVEDTRRAIEDLLKTLKWPGEVQSRCGDTSASTKARQKQILPSVLITTPESLSLLLSYESTHHAFQGLQAVVVDEWHELLSTKRGVQTELCLARLRQWRPSLQTWGLSATLGNLHEAMQALLGIELDGRLICATSSQLPEVQTLMPKQWEVFPWAGHLGQRMVEQVVEAIEAEKTTLVFTNVRSQAEWWFQALLQKRSEWEGEVGLHHGSLEKSDRLEVEQRLSSGKIRVVVCTSSLDLGVDFSPVDQVIQIGGPKGVARLLQRAGRSGHRPGRTSRILCVPTHAMEILEFAAAREAMKQGRIESREPLRGPLDVLAQHMVTLAMGGGFHEEQAYQEVRKAWSYRALSPEEWSWVLEFITQGGACLKAYDQFRKVKVEKGFYSVVEVKTARLHRMSIGTIASDPAMQVRMIRGKRLGTIEESFVSRLKPGVHFVFAGCRLELVRVRDMTAWVRRAKGGRATVSVWSGGQAPLSSELAAEFRRTLEDASDRCRSWPEVRELLPLLSVQASQSMIPGKEQLLMERLVTRQGVAWFLYPFEGRLSHEGLASLLAYRMSLSSKMSLSMTFNDYGIHILSEEDPKWTEQDWRRFLDPQNLSKDLEQAIHTVEMDRRQFRDVARIAGLIHQGFPGARKPTRQLQVSSELLFEVFRSYDPQNLLLKQTRREVLSSALDWNRMERALQQISHQQWSIVDLQHLSPFAFPLWAEAQRRHVSSESWTDRMQRHSQREQKRVQYS